MIDFYFFRFANINQRDEYFCWIEWFFKVFLQFRHTREKVRQGDTRAFSTGTIMRLTKKSAEDGFDFGKASDTASVVTRLHGRDVY